MKSGHDLTGLMKFLQRKAWEEAFSNVLNDHFGMALDAFDLDYDDLADLLDDQWVATLWGCAFEDFLTRTVAPGGQNLVDVYLKKRGFKESAQAKAYMKALRDSYMSLYEVSDIVPGLSFRARDLIGGGEPMLVHDTTATRMLKPWEKIAARMVPVAGRIILAGGLLPFSPEAASAIVDGLAASDKAPPGRGRIAGRDTPMLHMAAPVFTTAWLLDVLPEALGDMPGATNRDGEDFVLHKFHYPLAKGVRQKAIIAQLAAIAALSRDSETMWNWLDDSAPVAFSSEKATDADAVIDAGFDLMTEDGRIILGHVELQGRFLILTTGSASRAARGTTMLQDAMGDLLLAPRVTIETLDGLEKESRDAIGPAEPAEVPSDIALPLIHGFLDRQYRQVLDEAVPMLDGVSPRAAVKSGEGRKKVADWLKYLENRSASHVDPNDPMATYDFGWLWRELGVDDLRR